MTPEDEIKMFGLTTAEIDANLEGLFTPAPFRYITHSQSILSDLQEVLKLGNGSPESIEQARQMANVAKYILSKAKPTDYAPVNDTPSAPPPPAIVPVPSDYLCNKEHVDETVPLICTRLAGHFGSCSARFTRPNGREGVAVWGNGAPAQIIEGGKR